MITRIQEVLYSEPLGRLVMINGVLHSVHCITDHNNVFQEYNFYPVESFDTLEEAKAGFSL